MSPGLPAWDCDTLAVQIERLFSHQGDITTQVFEAREEATGFAMRGAVVAIWLMRCVGTMDNDGSPLPTSEIECDAALVLDDPLLMLHALLDAQEAGTLPGCAGLAFEDWLSLGPEGGVAGGVMRIRVDLSGDFPLPTSYAFAAVAQAQG